ncbi:hypothetical protein [Amnibacterium endophyticum]|uniref:Uncharacterized protein n=1 Tax=Amnibacterium endophyticum TaxID=2109337 RepID=A0ABW4LFP5_9MICO
MPAATRLLVRVASGAYLANCALGTAVATRVVDTRRHRWVHHALYIVTAATTAAAVGAGIVQRSAPGIALAPALAPLAVLPHAGHGMHARTALTAAPWYAGALLIRGGA